MKEFIKNSDSFFNFITCVVEARDRSRTLNNRVEDVRDYLGADRCMLFLYDKQAGELVSRVAQGSKNVERLPVNKESLVGYCFLSGKSLCINDAYDEHELKAVDAAVRFSKKQDEATGYRTKSVLVTPIIVRGKRVGVFQAVNKPGGFINYSVEGLIDFAPMIGLAVEIVMLDEALKKGTRYEDLPFTEVD
jgi:GAF domain-containing protein